MKFLMLMMTMMTIMTMMTMMMKTTMMRMKISDSNMMEIKTVVHNTPSVNGLQKMTPVTMIIPENVTKTKTMKAEATTMEMAIQEEAHKFQITTTMEKMIPLIVMTTTMAMMTKKMLFLTMKTNTKIPMATV